MTLLAIAEVMSGEALVSPGGPIDRDTTITDEAPLWQHAPEGAAPSPADKPADPVPHPVLEEVLVPA
jgi:hypothetical protein